MSGLFNFALATNEFESLAKDIGNKRIVFLDELTHGEKEVFKLKVDITQYLHEFHNFDAIVLESGMYDMAELWASDKSILNQSQGNIFYMYANEPAFHPLLTYIDQQRSTKRPLVLAGFDGRLSGEISINTLPSKLKEELTRWLPKVLKSMDWQRYQEILIATLKRDVENFENSQQWFEQQTVYLKDELLAIKTAQSGYDSPAYMAHLLDGLLIVANNLWGKRRFDEHDIAMANNLDWLLNTELKDKKVLVWGQFIHLNKHYYTTSKTDNVTSIIKKRYPNQTYVVHFAGLEGQYRNFISGKIEDISNNASSAERWLWQQNKSDAAYKFYSPNQQQNLLSNSKQNLSFYGLQYKTQLPAHHWHLYWDGLFLLDKVSATR
ncbi:MAG: erythromycin esterase family protein [Gammaproteobacteria bacterium]|nr:erythromycin esterase family protein [Gammaproteobacteria bacterium]